MKWKTVGINWRYAYIIHEIQTGIVIDHKVDSHEMEDCWN
jgi:hypothetical protein